MTIMRKAAVILGVMISPAAIAQQSADPTFAENVAPIIYENCVECHRPGSIAPMTLIDYETVRAWAPVIKDRVVRRKMPPYFIDKTVGVRSFEDDRSLTDSEIQTETR